MRRPFSVSPLHRHLISFSLVLLGGAASVILQQPAIAAGGDPYAAGVKLLTAKQFPQAIQQFQAAVKANPKNAMAHYYLGLAKHYKGDRQGAMEAYSKVLSDFPGTDACNLAIRGMSSIDPTILQQLGLAPAARPAATSGGSRSSGNQQQGDNTLDYDRVISDDKLPDETRIPFTLKDGCMIMDGRVGGRGMQWIFDTGAEHVVIGKNQLANLGLSEGKFYKKANVYGSGSAGGNAVNINKLDVQLGNIVRNNFPVLVPEHLDNYPLIGQIFFNDFQITVDSKSRYVSFRKRAHAGGVASTSNAPLTAYDVPIRIKGREVLVDAQINGKTVPMILDTGCTWVTLTMGQASSLGIEVPPNAPSQASRGVNGQSTTYFVNVPSLKVGPIEKRNFRIGVADNTANEYPLLGAEFLGDLQYTVDYDRKVLHFGR